MRSYFKRIKDILTYYDYEPLIFFVALFDIVHLSSTLFYKSEYSEWCNTFQEFILSEYTRFYTWMPLLYWLSAILIIVFINNPKWLSRIIIFHVLQDLVYIIDQGGDILITSFLDPKWALDNYWYLIDFVRQLFWAFAWIWILFQMKKKELYQRLGL